MDYLSKQKRNIKIYYLLNLLEGFMFTIPVWYSFQKLYISIEQISILYAITNILVVLFEMPTGAFADLLGRKTSMFIGWLISSFSLIAIGLSTEYWQFIIAFVFNSLGVSLVSGANYALLYDSLKEIKREKEFSKTVANLGFPVRMTMMVATFSGGYLFSIKPGLPYIAQGLVMVVLAACILLLVEPEIDSDKFTIRNYILQTKRGFKELLKNNYTRTLAAYYFICAGLSWTMLTYFRLPLAYSFDFTEKQVSLFIGIGYFATILMLISAAKLEKIFTPKIIFILTPIILVCITLPSFILPKFLIPLILVMIQVIGSARFTFLDSYTNQEFESKYRATAVSSLNMLVSLVYFFLVLLSGPIIKYTNVKVYISGMGLLALVITLPLTILLLSKYKEHNGRLSKIETDRSEFLENLV